MALYSYTGQTTVERLMPYFCSVPLRLKTAGTKESSRQSSTEEETTTRDEFGRVFSFFFSFFFFPSHLLSSPFYCLSLIVVTQIRGHIAGSSPPLPTTVRALYLLREKMSALPSLGDSRRSGKLTPYSYRTQVVSGRLPSVDEEKKNSR